MGWSVYVALTRDRPLSADERRALVALVAEYNVEPWAVEPFDLLLPPPRRRGTTLAYGAVKLPRDPDHDDIARLLAALSDLRGLIDGASCDVADDDAIVVWTNGGYELAIGSQPDVAMPDTRGWNSARALVASLIPNGAPRRAVAPSSPLDAALQALAGLPRTRSATDRQEKRVLALIDAVAGDPGLRVPVLEAWRQHPAATGPMRSLGGVLQPLVACSWFADELLASVARAGQPGERGRSSAAADLLREGGDPRWLAAVLAAMRRYRYAPETFVEQPFADDELAELTIERLMWQPHLWRGELAPPDRAGAMASCILALASPGSTGFVVRAAIKLGGAAALPYVERMPPDHPHALGAAYALPGLVRTELGCLDRAASLCVRYVAHPFVDVRIRACRALCELRGPQAGPLFERALELAKREGVESDVDRAIERIAGGPATVDPAIDAALAREPPLADPLADLLSRDRWHRAQGVRRYEQRYARTGGPMLPMLLYDELNDQLPRHEQGRAPSWYDWTALPAPARRRAARAERAAWIRAHATPAERAAMPAALREVETLGAGVVAARFAAPLPPVIELSSSERAALEAAERAYLDDA